jgi:hypothetical protein
LSRASITQRGDHKPYRLFVLPLIIDCRVQPGNDDGEVECVGQALNDGGQAV